MSQADAAAAQEGEPQDGEEKQQTEEERQEKERRRRKKKKTKKKKKKAQEKLEERRRTKALEGAPHFLPFARAILTVQATQRASRPRRIQRPSRARPGGRMPCTSGSGSVPRRSRTARPRTKRAQ